MLCRDGIVHYKLKHVVLTLITDAWLSKHVVPNVRCRYPRAKRLCRVLTLSLLCICLFRNKDVIIPDTLRHQVKAAHAALGLEEGVMVEKVQLYVYRMPNGMFDISDTVPT